MNEILLILVKLSPQVLELVVVLLQQFDGWGSLLKGLLVMVRYHI